MRTGNPAVLYDSLKTYESQLQINSYLNNHGFFDALVTAEVKKRRKKAFVTYQIVENEVYLVDSVFQRVEDENILKLLVGNRESLIRVEVPYNQAALTNERQRV